MIAGSDKGSDTDPFADLDKDEDQTEENLAPWVQSACAKASCLVFEQVEQLSIRENYSRKYGILSFSVWP